MRESTVRQILTEPADEESVTRDNEFDLEMYTKNVFFLLQIVAKYANNNLVPTQTLLTVEAFRGLLSPKQIYTLLRDMRLKEHAELFKFYLSISSRLTPPKLLVMTGQKVFESVQNILLFIKEQRELGNDNPDQDDKIIRGLMRQLKLVDEHRESLKRFALEMVGVRNC